ncbi:MAG: lysozyme, partial [Nanoarchaeota archaeon]
KGNENYEIIGREEAEQLLIKDMVIAEKAVSNLVSVHLTQNQYDALVSFVYNVGRGNFERSTMLIKLNSKNYKGASLEFKRWNKAGGKVVKGLINRRQKEEVLFNEVRSKRWNH